MQLSLPCKAAVNVCPTSNQGYDRSRNTYIYMTSNLETIEVSKVRGVAPAPQISAMPSSMAADPRKRFFVVKKEINSTKQKFLTGVIRRKYVDVFDPICSHDRC